MVARSDPVRSAFDPMPRDALARRVARALTDAIVAGRLRPGDRVAESVIAREMGLSRAPVREAARLLESAGLLVSEPNRGFFVRRTGAEDIDSLYELRICVEREAAARLARCGGAQAAPALTAQITEMRRLADAGDPIAQIGADMQFHRLIVEASGNRRFLAVFDQLAQETQAGVAIIGRLYDDPLRMAETHAPIVDAIAAADPEAARAAIDHHIGVAREIVVALFRDIEENRSP
jgi:DNA-binding GntR family transcriptional regulator